MARPKIDFPRFTDNIQIDNCLLSQIDSLSSLKKSLFILEHSPDFDSPSNYYRYIVDFAYFFWHPQHAHTQAVGALVPIHTH